jgi:O-acetyl-ADP-ribose deacetylase (regulator of RNase III)
MSAPKFRPDITLLATHCDRHVPCATVAIRSKVVIEHGDITQFKSSQDCAIVNAAKCDLTQGGGVCGAIFKAAGSVALAAEIKKHKDDGEFVVSPGRAYPTSSHNIGVGTRIKHIIHATTSCCTRTGHPTDAQQQTLLDAVEAVHDVARELNVKSIAMCCLGSGATHAIDVCER